MTDDEWLEAVVGMSMTRAIDRLGVSRDVLKDMVAKSKRFRLAKGKQGALVVKRRPQTASADDVVELLEKEGRPLTQGEVARGLSVSPQTVKRIVAADDGARLVVTRDGVRGSVIIQAKRPSVVRPLTGEKRPSAYRSVPSVSEKMDVEPFADDDDDWDM